MSSSTSATAIKRKPLRISMWNLVLLCVASLGIGMLWAYSIFYAGYTKACQEAMLEQEVSILNSCKAKYEGQAKAECASSNHKDDSAAIRKSLQESEQALFQLQGAVQRRAQSECLHRYGQPPYVVEIWFGTEYDQEEHVIPIQLSHVNDMPFTTDSFLQLIEYGLYTETTMGPQSGTGRRNIVGGNPSDAPTRVRTRLLRSYAELGYGTSATPFILDESTTSSSSSSSRTPCSEPYSFGFATQGPEFTIFVTSPEQTKAGMPVQCIGRVLPEGHRAIDLLQTLPGPDSARIIEVRIQGVDNEESGQRGEEL